jgi:hypothetical protein
MGPLMIRGVPRHSSFRRLSVARNIADFSDDSASFLKAMLCSRGVSSGYKSGHKKSGMSCIFRHRRETAIISDIMEEMSNEEGATRE